MLIEKVLSGIVPTLQVVVTAKFLDTALSVVSKKMSVKEVFIPLILMVLLIVYSWLSEQLIKFIDVKLEMRLREKFRVNITEKRARLKYSHMENNNTWDLTSRVAKEPEGQCKRAYNEFLAMIAMFVRIAGLLLVLITHVWWAAIVILGISVPLFRVA